MATKKRTSKKSQAKANRTYRFAGGQVFLGGGLDVEVEAGSREEALTKAKRALRMLKLSFQGSQLINGVRCVYDVASQEAFLGED